MRKIDVNKINNLAKRRKQTEYFFTLITLFIFISAIWLSSKVKSFNLDRTNHNILYFGSLAIIFIFLVLFLLMLLELMKPRNILQYDLKIIYIKKTAKKVIEVPIIDITRVRVRVKSRKKSKRPFGTLIIRTKNKRFRLKNIFAVENVKKEIERLYERLAAYNEGYKQAEKERLEKNED